jgi:A/G-specific adenine glycosylase
MARRSARTDADLEPLDPDPAEVAARVVAGFRQQQRDLPWRRTRDPYAIWVSEIMLQQTRVAAVIPYFERWLARFPTVEALAAAPLDDVLAHWAGLGYYSRARNLHRGAAEVVAQYRGALPRDPAALGALPGIGRYTAGAIASIAHGVRAPLVDGNVARVLARLYAIEGNIKATATTQRLWQLAERLVPDSAPGDFNQGLMELGATVCTPTSPTCLVCPLRAICRAHRDGREAELPEMPARKRPEELPLLASSALWIEADGALLLARRRPTGLYGGLWELPQAAGLDDAAALVGRLTGRPVEIADMVPVHRHAQLLTHRRLRIAVHRARLGGTGLLRLVDAADPGYDTLSWLSLDDAGALGVSAATAAILAHHRKNDGWRSIPRPSPSSKSATGRSSKGSPSSATRPETRTSRTPRAGRRRASTSSSTTTRR